MHIAFSVIKDLDFGGGIERYTRAVAARLAQRGHRIEVYSMRHYGLGKGAGSVEHPTSNIQHPTSNIQPRPSNIEQPPEAIRVVRVPCVPGVATEKLTASAAAAVACAARRPKPDLVHFHSVAAGAFAWLPKSQGIPSVLQLHGVEWQRSRWNRFGRRALRLLERCALPQADALTGVSQALCDFYSRRYGLRLTYIPTGAEVKEAVPPRELLRLGLQPRRYILFAARLVREKGAHHLIRAFRQLNPDCHLVLAGEAKGEAAYHRELRELAAGDARIVFPGFVQGRLLEELFSHALVFVQPSELEGLSLSLLEAMSYGNLCLASDIPENVEALGGTGVLFATRDAADLTAKLRAALASPDGGWALGEQARRRVAEHFSWERVTDQLEAFYFQLLKRE